jgi:hypothetical protein
VSCTEPASAFGSIAAFIFGAGRRVGCDRERFAPAPAAARSGDRQILCFEPSQGRACPIEGPQGAPPDRAGGLRRHWRDHTSEDSLMHPVGTGRRHRASLTFGAAARLRLLPHTASRRQAGLSRDAPACSCLRLAVASNLLRRGLAPPIQGPCLAHQGCSLRSHRLRRLKPLTPTLSPAVHSAIPSMLHCYTSDLNRRLECSLTFPSD